MTKSLSNMTSCYQDAVRTLNSFQSTPAMRQLRKSSAPSNVNMTKHYLDLLGITTDDLDSLKIIHVSGTKGKGSTCALCESMLRHRGLKTGMFTSPHLVSVRERIRINGKPLSQQQFAGYFWEVKKKLSCSDSMPAYFMFLTVMAFWVFVSEKVDVAIVEVGIGGTNDSTNVLRRPAVVGIASLGLDHVATLGNTIESIAAHKAGIMKPGVVAVTSPHQPESALHVLRQHAAKTGCELHVAAELISLAVKLELGIEGDVQQLNAALALELCHRWLGIPPMEVTSDDVTALKLCKWPGRCQVLKYGQLSFYLDGAHTIESIQHSVNWFSSSVTNCEAPKLLIFHATRGRDAHSLLTPIAKCQFQATIFCTPNASDDISASSDNADLTVTLQDQLRTCQIQQDAWVSLTSDPKSMVISSAGRVIEWIQSEYGHCNQAHIFITGSLHLVGTFLATLDSTRQ